MNTLNKNIIYAGIAATTYMTLFSYLVSEKKNRNFKEPELLGKMLYRVLPFTNDKSSKALGWLLHYGTGILFTCLYYELISKKKIKNNIVTGAVTGGLSGIPAVIIWDTVFKYHPHPPRISFKKYYGHLILAHVVFGTAAFKFLKK